MAAVQNISPHTAGRHSSSPIQRPYSSWNGSSMVTAFVIRIFCAKKKPPSMRLMA